MSTHQSTHPQAVEPDAVGPHLLVERTGVGLWCLDGTGTTTFANPAVAALLGERAEDLPGRALAEFAPGPAEARAMMSVPAPPEDMVLHTRHGDVVWVMVSTTRLGGPGGEVLLSLVDVTARHERDLELRRATERYHLAFASAPTGMALVDGVGRITDVNPALCELLGAGRGTLVGERISALAAPADVHDLADLFKRVAARYTESGTVECRLRRGDGGLAVARATVSRIRGEDHDAFLCQAEDVTDQRLAVEALARRSLRDPLTGLPNRSLLRDRLEQVPGRWGTGRDSSCAVLYADIDGFRALNEAHGHGAGDAVLREVARRMAAVVRPTDTVARVGGDEFVILLDPVAGRAEARAIAERLRTEVARPVPGGPVGLRPTVSIGLAVGRVASSSPRHLLRAADVAMYAAVEAGGDRVVVAADGDRTDGWRHVEELLRDVARGGTPLLHYQPVVDLRRGRVSGAEALMRLDDGDAHLLPPSDFLAVAEDSDLIVALGASALNLAAATASAWPTGALQVGVNLSLRQFTSGSLAEDVAEVLARHHLEPGRLCLEVTESVLVEALATARPTLEAVRDLGVVLALDDFGTGWSSLSRLGTQPVDALKIDARFVAGLGNRSEDTALVRAICGLGAALGLDTVAEGVEDQGQLDRLVELGCTHAQGFLLSPPVPVDQLEAACTAAEARLTRPEG